MDPITNLESVLCDPSGKCCIAGSDKDRAIVDAALTALKAIVAQSVQPATCQHSIADARNPVVKSGYFCIKCGALFSAADHAQSVPPTK